MMKTDARRAVTTIELLVAMSIISTLVVIGASTYGGVRQQAFEAECRAQLTDIGAAMVAYREDHRGQDAGHLVKLVPEYLDAKALVCPLVRARAPQAVGAAQRIMQPTPFRYFASYFAFHPRALDRLYERGELVASYSQTLRKRGGDTPLTVCFDHREPWSLRGKGVTTPEMEQGWFHPERPLIVLRYSGRVDAKRYGGVATTGDFPDTDALLEKL